MNPRIISGIKQTASILLQNGGVNKALNNSIGAAQNTLSVSKTIAELGDEVSGVKDRFINTKAKANIEKMLGVNSSVANAEEKLRRELIDTQFSSVQRLFRRVQNSFIPTEFPSGEKIGLKKSILNEIANNAIKGKETNFEYTNKSGETIRGFISKKVQKQGEDCFLVQIQKIGADKTTETIETRYYPKSSEIRSVGKKANGQKTISIITGNEDGGKVKGRDLGGTVTDIIV